MAVNAACFVSSAGSSRKQTDRSGVRVITISKSRKGLPFSWLARNLLVTELTG